MRGELVPLAFPELEIGGDELTEDSPPIAAADFASTTPVPGPVGAPVGSPRHSPGLVPPVAAPLIAAPGSMPTNRLPWVLVGGLGMAVLALLAYIVLT